MYCRKQRSSELTIHQFAEQSMKHSIYITTFPIIHYCHRRKTNIFIVTHNRKTTLRNPQFIILLCSLWITTLPVNRYCRQRTTFIFIVMHTVRSYKQWNLIAKRAPWIADTPHCTKQCMIFETHYTRYSYLYFDKYRGYVVSQNASNLTYVFTTYVLYNVPRVYYSLWFQASAAM
jgi:hypothetical protein